MTLTEARSYLELYLEPLSPWLGRDDVTDIYINRPGEVWVETLGGQITRYDAHDLDEGRLWGLARQIASRSHQGISRSHPLLSAALPDGARIQIVAPPATRSEMAVAIRKHAAHRLPLSSYASAIGEPNVSKTSHADLQPLIAAGDYAAFMAQAVKRRLKHHHLRWHIGGLNDPPQLALVRNPGPRAADFYRGYARASADPSEQRRPDRRARRPRRSPGDHRRSPGRSAANASGPDHPGRTAGPEAFTFLRAINTGHPGSLTTIHADSPSRAIVQLSMMALQADLGLSYGDVRQLILAMVDVVIQIERRDGRPGYF